MFVCLAATVVLGGCHAFRSEPRIEPASGPGPDLSARGTLVPAPAAGALDSAPTGGRFEYRLPDGRPVAVVLGGAYQSGLQVPCRLGRLSPGGSGPNAPPAYAFCRINNQWYQMAPVVVSGF